MHRRRVGRRNALERHKLRVELEWIRIARKRLDIIRQILHVQDFGLRFGVIYYARRCYA